MTGRYRKTLAGTNDCLEGSRVGEEGVAREVDPSLGVDLKAVEECVVVQVVVGTQGGGFGGAAVATLRRTTGCCFAAAAAGLLLLLLLPFLGK